MDQKIPFTSYDFWAYLSVGFLMLFAVDSAADTKLLMRDRSSKKWLRYLWLTRSVILSRTCQAGSSSETLFGKILGVAQGKSCLASLMHRFGFKCCYEFTSSRCQMRRNLPLCIRVRRLVSRLRERHCFWWRSPIRARRWA